MLIKNRRDLISAIADDTGQSRKLVAFVIKEFEKELRWRITHPLDAGKRIELFGSKRRGTFGLGYFEFNDNRAADELHDWVKSGRNLKREVDEFQKKFRQTEDEDNNE